MSLICIKPSADTQRLAEQLGIKEEIARTLIEGYLSDKKNPDIMPSLEELEEYFINTYYKGMSYQQKKDRMDILKNREITNGKLSYKGQESKLSLSQYIEVRTKEFKDWFGDWENDPENASKVVDTNGEPLLLIHRTPENFEEFDLSNFGKTDTGYKGKGFYFAKLGTDNQYYGKNKIFAFLNIKNPYNGNPLLASYINRGMSEEEIIQDIKKYIQKSHPNADDTSIDAEIRETFNTKGNLFETDGYFVQDDYEVVALSKFQIKEDSRDIVVGETDNRVLKFRTTDISTEKLSAKERMDKSFGTFEKGRATQKVANLFSKVLKDIFEKDVAEMDSRIANETNPTRKTLLQRARNEMSKINTLKLGGFTRIYEGIQKELKAYIQTDSAALEQSYIDNIRQQEQQLIEDTKDLPEEERFTEADRYSEEELQSRAKEAILDRKQYYQKILDNLKMLCYEASDIIQVAEGITFDYDGRLYDSTYEEVNEGEERSASYEDNNQTDGEIQPREHWQLRAHSVSQYESLSNQTRQILSTIQIVDEFGDAITDSHGDVIFLNAGVAHATLLEKLQGMTRDEELIPCLEKAAEGLPWIQQLIDKLQQDTDLQTAFYSDLRKDFLHMTAQVVQKRGTSKEKTVIKDLNKATTGLSIQDNAKSSIEAHIFYSKLAIYDNEGGVDKENASKLLSMLQPIKDRYIELKNEGNEAGALDYLASEEVLDVIYEAICAMGISTPIDTLTQAAAIQSGNESLDRKNMPRILIAITSLMEQIDKGTIKNTVSKEGNLEIANPAEKGNNFYITVGEVLSKFSMSFSESSFNERHKGYFSYGNPSFMTTLVKRLRGEGLTDEEYRQWLTKEYFEDCDWFKMGNTIMLPILQQLYENPSLRKEIEFKQVIHTDGKELEELVGADYTGSCLTEFTKSESSTYTWYALPVTSNSGAHEFIRLPKYTGYSSTGDYTNTIIEKLVPLVYQETRRIALVKDRAADPNIVKIDNFDITDKSLGGSIFKFIPLLNTHKDAEGRIMIEALAQMKREQQSKTTVDKYIQTQLREVLDTMFETSYKDMYQQGLFDTDANGRPTYEGMKKGEPKALKDAMTKAKELLEDNKALWTKDIRKLYDDILYDRYIDYSKAQPILDSLIKKLKINGVVDTSLYNKLKLNSRARENYRVYWYNNQLAKNTIIQLTTTDLAFYSSETDFYKRYKEVHAPGIRVNTHATWKGERVGTDVERSITLAEAKKDATSEAMQKALDKRVEMGGISKKEADIIFNSFKSIDEADGQSYRTLKSYRKLCIMSNKWSDELEKAYNNIQSGKWEMSDYMVFFNSIKPYAYSNNIKMDSGVTVTDDSGVTRKKYSSIKTPVQHKNSESVLPSLFMAMMGSVGETTKLSAIQEWMDANDIDVVHMHSVVKVGGHGQIDLNGIEDAEEIKTVLNKGLEKDYLTEMPYENYYIQGNISEHIIDAEQLLGSQMKKIILQDLPEGHTWNINGKSYTKEELIKHYQRVMSQNIIDSFKEVSEIFSSPKILERELQKQIASSSRYDKDLAIACTWNEENQSFNLPLTDPIQSQRIQELINSILKNRVNKQKVKGGSLVQVSGFGYSSDLHIQCKENGGVDCVEVYMPAYSEDFIKCYMKEDGTIDIDKVPENLLQLIGYRIPTENKYSILPMKIKGFLPQYYGSTVILPAEIVQTTGSDFDIDKLYIFLPESSIINQKTDYEQGRKDFNLLYGVEVSEEEVTNITQITGRYETPEGKQFMQWWEKNQHYYQSGGDMVKIEYNNEVSETENNKRQRNNELFDIMYAIMTDVTNTEKQLQSGGFEGIKFEARVFRLFQEFSMAELKSFCDLPEDASVKSVMRILQKKDRKELEAKLQEKDSARSPLDHSLQAAITAQNMAGNNLVSIYAVGNASHALTQHTKLALDSKAAVTLNGKTLTSLHEVKDSYGRFISSSLCQFVAASVDNAKDPILSFLNQTMWTAGLTTTLVRLGYSTYEIAALLNQPIVKEIALKAVKAKSASGVKTVIEDTIDYYKKLQQSYEQYHNLNVTDIETSIKDTGFSVDRLIYNIVSAKDMQDFSSSTIRTTYYRDQAQVGELLLKIDAINNELKNVLQGTRGDSSGGMAGPTIADNLVKIRNSRINLDALQYIDPKSIDFYIDPTDFSKLPQTYIMQVQEAIEGNSMEIQNAFHLLGVVGSERLFNKYFHYYNPTVFKILDVLEGYSASDNVSVFTTKTLLNDLDAYLLGSMKVFNDDTFKEIPDAPYGFLKPMTLRQKRHYYADEFIDDCFKIINDDRFKEELDNNYFTKVLRAYSDKTNNFRYIGIQSSGTLSKESKKQLTAGWEALMYSEHPELRHLAYQLLTYQYFRKGLNFGNKTFTHLAPISLKKAFPEYESTLRSMLDFEWNGEQIHRFVIQFIRNHMQNNALVSQIKKSLENSGVTLENIPDTFEPNPKDKVLVKNWISVNGEPQPIFKNFISVKLGKDTVYYMLKTNEEIEYYEKITPLGVKNNALEYYPNEDNPMSEFIGKQEEDSSDDSENPKTPDDGVTPQTKVQSSKAETKASEKYSEITGEPSPEQVQELMEEINFKDDENIPLCNIKFTL